MNLTDHDKAQIEKIKPNTQIRILNEEHSEYVQKMAFEAGYRWVHGGKNVRYTDKPSLSFRNIFGLSIHYSSVFVFLKSSIKEIFIDLPPKQPKIDESSPSTTSNKIKPPFKFRNANLPVVRQWLKDNGYAFTNYSLDIFSWNMDAEFGYVNKSGNFSTSYIIKDEGADAYDSSLELFNLFKIPEIEFDFEIRDISIDNSSEIAKLESELEVVLNKKDEIQAKLLELKS